MPILWLDLLLVSGFAWMARYFAIPSTSGPALINPNKMLAVMAALALILVAGLRLNIGDTFFYMHSYKETDFRWDYVIQQKDMGFNLLQMALKSMSDDPQILIFVTALITNALIVLVLYRYTRLFELGLYLYITTGAFIVSMNGIRQYLAAAIAFAATKYLLEGNVYKYMSVVLVASFFHQSALVMIPLYFIVRRKAWTGATFGMLLLAIAIVMGYNQFSDMLFTAIKDTQYGQYSTFSEGGANVLRVLIDSVPLVIAFMGREKLRTVFPKVDIIVNLATLGFVLMVISTQNWIFARMAIYFSLYQIILMTWIILCFRKKDRKLIYFTMVILYLIFFFYENVITLGLDYRSAYLIWPF
ncbi:EpsG family protein [Paenibacillus nasutitermitis]|uniref:Transmembrane protein EpsG n=1 Tax=Paenibacillus nasutitermitis TaxID=1652958 RepID=A0A917DVS3_9BACL|nr:EpsG family protein [Paenibacillus nasutitermitis]GGD73352.1 transmembrane protein EpsG [Paenibacillus nasutitermitis]